MTITEIIVSFAIFATAAAGIISHNTFSIKSIKDIADKHQAVHADASAHAIKMMEARWGSKT